MQHHPIPAQPTHDGFILPKKARPSRKTLWSSAHHRNQINSLHFFLRFHVVAAAKHRSQVRPCNHELLDGRGIPSSRCSSCHPVVTLISYAQYLIQPSLRHWLGGGTRPLFVLWRRYPLCWAMAAMDGEINTERIADHKVRLSYSCVFLVCPDFCPFLRQSSTPTQLFSDDFGRFCRRYSALRLGFSKCSVGWNDMPRKKSRSRSFGTTSRCFVD